GLGVVYALKGDHEQAISCFHKAIDRDPKNQNAHESLGTALVETGRLTEARDALKQVLDWTAKTSDQFPTRQKLLASAEALLRLEPRLEEIGQGALAPKNSVERLQFARLCLVKQYYGAASRLYEEALKLE